MAFQRGAFQQGAYQISGVIRQFLKMRKYLMARRGR